MSWHLIFATQAQKDAKKLAKSGLKDKAEIILDILKLDPFQNPPRYEKLVGDLDGTYSRRVNIQHRIVYQVIKSKKVIKIIRMWAHYE